MKLIAWNSQGGKWDTAFTSYVAPLVAAQDDDVVLTLVEAGWAPWVASGQVTINGCYWLMSNMTWYDQRMASKSFFCQGVERRRKYKAMWVPWVGNLEAMKTNTRCSLGCALFPYQFWYIEDCVKVEGLLRPVLRLRIGKGSNVLFTILVVHMVSGRPDKAEAQLLGMMTRMRSFIPEGTAALIIGDMNVDLLKGTMTDIPKNWSIVRTGIATQQSGGELDYGLLYDPKSQHTSAGVAVLQKYKSGPNQSDHSVLMYNL